MIKIIANFDIGKEYEQMYDALRRELNMIGGDIRRYIINVLEAAGKKATGDLINSIEEEVRLELFTSILTVGPNSDAPHAIFVEEDTPPRWVPIAPLKKWARDKFGAFGKEKDNIAYAVRWKIHKKGTKGIHFMDQAFAFYNPLIEPKMNAVISRFL